MILRASKLLVRLGILCKKRYCEGAVVVESNSLLRGQLTLAFLTDALLAITEGVTPFSSLTSRTSPYPQSHVVHARTAPFCFITFFPKPGFSCRSKCKKPCCLLSTSTRREQLIISESSKTFFCFPSYY